MSEIIEEELVITTGGLYSPFPIPAYKILGNAGEHVAKDVLLCLVSHLGLAGKKAYPSLTLISKESGRSRSSVVGGIRTLEDFGFVKKFQISAGEKRLRNIYYLQDCCWNNDRMNSTAMEFAPYVGRCGCGAKVKLGEVGAGMLGFHHFSCGDLVTMYSTRAEFSESNPLAKTRESSIVRD